jgi:phosphoglucosamine mutase
VGSRFGTDGVRGVANVVLTPELALALGRAAARVMPAERLLIGRDTRRSGPLIEAAFAAGVASEGTDAVSLGVFPTAGVAWAGQAEGVPAAVISASHNPFPDNGVKLFAPGGRKLGDELQDAIEADLDRLLVDPSSGPRRPFGRGVGLLHAEDHREAYLEHLLAALDGRDLSGLTVCLDCANGAASGIAPEAFRRAGAEVAGLVGSEPDGTNINEGCGSTNPAALVQAVAEHGAALGLAFDGDADRVVPVGEDGTVGSGDELLALFAADLAARGQLAGNTVVVTVMSNLGLRRSLEAQGIGVVETPVGDRHVLDALEREGLVLGGEQSGHLVFPPLATTGDGILTGLLFADLVKRSGKPAGRLIAEAIERVPQLLASVPVADPAGAVQAEPVRAVVEALEGELAGRGRLLVRPSGTEPVVRVMVEADDPGLAEQAVRRLVDVLERSPGGS